MGFCYLFHLRRCIRCCTQSSQPHFRTYTSIFVSPVLHQRYCHVSLQSLYSTNAVIQNLFLDQELPDSTFKKTFFDIGQFDELASYIVGPLSDGLYPTSLYNGRALAPGKELYLQEYLRLVQGARLWLVRVSNVTSCSTIQKTSEDYSRRFDNPDSACYGSVDEGADVETQPFGPPEMPDKYQFSPHVGSVIAGKSGWGQNSYGVGGYAVFLPENGTRGSEILQELVDDTFFDDRMRVLVVDFNLYNSNTNLLTVVRLILEFLPTGLFVQR
jgi:hypothetical protein